jgi:hypothetical protein
MEHVIFSRRSGQTAKTLDAPISAGRYLQLRREAAGFTIAQIAERLAPAHKDRSDAVALIKILERDGARPRHEGAIAVLRTIFPFDIAVYRQLCETPADRHPLICRGCGCSRYDLCEDETGCCHFEQPGQCTRCTERAAQTKRFAA